jgi:hypothetical protein
MNSQTAQEILSLFRPGTADAEDPEFAPALDQVKNDPELQHWFESHCAAYEAVRAKFRQIPVPEGLKEQILSERRVHTRYVVRRKLIGLALALGCLVVLAGLARVWLQPVEDNRFIAFQSRMARSVLRQYPKMDLLTSDLSRIQQYLRQKGCGDYVLPTGLTRTPGTGCAVLQWHGNPVTMICFNSGKTASRSDPDLFLFIVNRDALAQPPASDAPEFARITRQMSAASWSRGNKTYVLAGLGDEALLRKHL